MPSADSDRHAWRLEALDVFRGLTIAGMILVSTPGTWDAVYGPLNHAVWNGWTSTDLVFPFLLFAMGAAVPFALARRRTASGVGRHVVRRAAILFALGLLLNAIEAGAFHAATFRIPGVLQRIALVYLAVAWLTEHASRRAQIAATAGSLAGYWLVMLLVPVPGAGAGVLTPIGNLASFLDRALLGSHLLDPLSDPEGLLSTVPAVATAMCGVFAGDWLRRPAAAHRALVLWAAGLIATLVGLMWGELFPINKNLWTSSFALFSAGAAAQGLAVCHWVVDVRHWRRWTLPLVAFGRNPLVAYFLSVVTDSLLTHWVVPTRTGAEVAVKAGLYHRAFAVWAAPRFGDPFASLLYALASVVVWALVVTAMYRRRVFIAI